MPKMNNNKELAVIMVGLPYNGKSYFIENHSVLSKLPIVSPDKYAIRVAEALNTNYNSIFNDLYPFAQNAALRELEDLVKENKSFVVDKANYTKIVREEVLKRIPEDKYNRAAVLIHPPSDEELTKRKVQRTSHRIPEAVLETMGILFQKPTFEEGFDFIIDVGFEEVVLQNPKYGRKKVDFKV